MIHFILGFSGGFLIVRYGFAKKEHTIKDKLLALTGVAIIIYSLILPYL